MWRGPQDERRGDSLFSGLADPEGEGERVLLQHRHQHAAPHDGLRPVPVCNNNTVKHCNARNSTAKYGNVRNSKSCLVMTITGFPNSEAMNFTLAPSRQGTPHNLCFTLAPSRQELLNVEAMHNSAVITHVQHVLIEKVHPNL